MVSEFLNSAFGVLSIELFFTICALSVFTAFIVCLFISVFKSDYILKKRIWYIIILALCCALLKARANFLGERDFAPLLCVLGLALFLPVYFVRVKPKKEDTEDLSRREFVRFLDGKIKRDNEESFARTNYNLPSVNDNVEVLKAEQKTENVSEGLDFSHVKNVLQRLEPASLSYSDRKQIHDLEMSLFEAERGDCSKEVKSKINEGLGNLLKIMAKHGV